MARALLLSALLFIQTATSFAEWQSVRDGIDYQRFQNGTLDVHVTRIDLSNRDLKVIATDEGARGTRVSDFAKRRNAIVAINTDYFDKDMRPIGLHIGPCGQWEGTKDTTREGVVAVGSGRAAIYEQKHVMEKPEPWIDAAVSGWPMIVKECRALKPSQLPGSDAFTRAPHPRTAIGLTKDAKTLFFVVADGRREGIPGATLARLAAFMRDELDVCSAMNLDGGGSSAMWIDGKIVNKPSDGSERAVANHIAVIDADDYRGCRTSQAAEKTSK